MTADRTRPWIGLDVQSDVVVYGRDVALGLDCHRVGGVVEIGRKHVEPLEGVGERFWLMFRFSRAVVSAFKGSCAWGRTEK